MRNLFDLDEWKTELQREIDRKARWNREVELYYRDREPVRSLAVVHQPYSILDGHASRRNSAATRQKAGVRRAEPTRLAALKIVRLSMVDGVVRFFSTFDSTEYRIGVRKYQLAGENHSGGYYVYRGTPREIHTRFMSGALFTYDLSTSYGLVECVVEPPFIAYDWHGHMVAGNVDPSRIKKAAVSGITPIRYLGQLAMCW